MQFPQLSPVDRAIAVATKYIGVGNAVKPREYLEIMGGPQESPATQAYLLSGPSTCALFLLGILRHCGCDAGVLRRPYVIASAIASLSRICSERGALRVRPRDGVRRGSMWLIDDSGLNSHVGICVSEQHVPSAGIIEIDTIEGGQGEPDVLAFRRRFVLRDGRWYLGSRDLWWAADVADLGLPPAEQSAEERETVEQAKLADVARGVLVHPTPDRLEPKDVDPSDR